MATARDVILIGILIFSLGLVFFISKFAINKITDDLLINPYVNATSESREVLQSTKDVTDRADYVIVGVFFGFILMLIIASWFVGGHPIFMIFYFIIIVISALTGAILANAWEEMTEQAVFENLILTFPMTNHIILSLPIYISIVGMIGIIIMFSKPKDDFGGGL